MDNEVTGWKPARIEAMEQVLWVILTVTYSFEVCLGLDARFRKYGDPHSPRPLPGRERAGVKVRGRWTSRWPPSPFPTEGRGARHVPWRKYVIVIEPEKT